MCENLKSFIVMEQFHLSVSGHETKYCLNEIPELEKTRTTKLCGMIELCSYMCLTFFCLNWSTVTFGRHRNTPKFELFSHFCHFSWNEYFFVKYIICQLCNVKWTNKYYFRWDTLNISITFFSNFVLVRSQKLLVIMKHKLYWW